MKKDVLINFTIFAGKRLCQNLFFNNVVGLRHATLLKKETLAQAFSCEFCRISKNTFFTEHLWTTASWFHVCAYIISVECLIDFYFFLVTIITKFDVMKISVDYSKTSWLPSRNLGLNSHGNRGKVASFFSGLGWEPWYVKFVKSHIRAFLLFPWCISNLVFLILSVKNNFPKVFSEISVINISGTVLVRFSDKGRPKELKEDLTTDRFVDLYQLYKTRFEQHV